MQIEEHGAGGIAGIGCVESATCEVPKQPGIDGAERQLAVLGSFSRALDIVQKPAKFASRKIGVNYQPGLASNVLAETLAFEFVTEAGCSSILPYDCIVERLASEPVPQNAGLALVGDADGRNIGSFQTAFSQGRPAHFKLALPNLPRIVL